MSRFRALVLDLGNVLVRSQPPDLVRRMSEIALVPLATFTKAYWSHRNAYDLHGDARRYWNEVLRDAGSPLDGFAGEKALMSLSAVDAESWTQYREELWEIAAAFRATGGQTALLSNCNPEVMGLVRAQRAVERYFDTLVVSSEVGCLKPDPAIYLIALRRLGVEPGDALFVDDRAENVAGATAVGLQALLFKGDGSVGELRRRLEQAT
ncbi:MAG TPA: HAD family phosphatase [Anaeromyxobacter sp.]|nr:HAD family phosphatase [Anaeromyxobacter sp.]